MEHDPMCDRCDGDQEIDEAATPGGARRIWDIPASFHCSIVGSCLTMQECRKILKKHLANWTPDLRDVVVHSRVVERCATRCLAAKAVQKTLQRKYAAPVKLFHRATTDAELLGLWREAKERGDVSGAYWALMSHRGVSERVITEIYGDVHMMSHLQGGRVRDSLKKVAQLEDRMHREKTRQDRGRTQTLQAAQEKDRHIQSLEMQLAELRGQFQVLRSRRESGPAQPRAEIDRRPDRTGIFERRIKIERARARAAESARDAAAREAAELKRALLAARGAGGARSKSASAASLDGTAILYVGGLVGSTERYRRLVEGRKGAFIYHDGGFEDGRQALDRMVSKADIVFCPVDCVSHEACLRVKGLCRRWSKMFVPLRSSGTSSFERALETTLSKG